MCDFCGVKGIPRPKPSVQLIALNKKDIRINNLELLRLGIKLANEIKNKKINLIDFPELKFIPGPDYPYIIDWLFVVNLLNFGFSTRPFKSQWTFQNHTGYLGICAAINRALQNGYDITNPDFYCNIPLELVETIFCGDNYAQIPLVYERMKALHSAGSALIRYFKGSFMNCIFEAGHSALNLVSILAKYFDYYCDKAYYDGYEVVFHRKAQLLIINLWVYFKNDGFGQFYDIDQLATSGCPLQLQQIFLHFNIFEYSEHLDKLTTSLSFLPPGSSEEVELRGCTVYVAELLRCLINETIGEKKCENPVFVSMLLSHVWKDIANDLCKNNVFHHMSKSIYY